jgi:Helix-turn-helix domain
MALSNSKHMLATAKAAEFLGISKASFYRLLRDGIGPEKTQYRKGGRCFFELTKLQEYKAALTKTQTPISAKG